MKCEPRRAHKPDAQPFDEIRIVTVPRYKTSGMSGDEWRISARTQFLRKGKVVAEFYNSSTEKACMFLPGRWFEAIDDGKGYYAGEGNICDQEGCAEEATVTLRLKKEFCSQGHESDPDKFFPEGLVRRFCKRHSRRGDCGLEDADRNYIVLEGNPSAPQPEDVKPSTFGGVVDLLGKDVVS